MTNKRSKLIKVNVPELFFLKFLAEVPRGESSIVDKIQDIKPSARGRGLTRVVEDITEDEWEDLYSRACAVRSKIKGSERSTELRPAICAREMTFRMEKAGVKSIVHYETPLSINGVKKADAIPAVTRNIPPIPITLDTVDDVDDAPDTELKDFENEIALGEI